jgi:hypothetical protein
VGRREGGVRNKIGKIERRGKGGRFYIRRIRGRTGRKNYRRGSRANKGEGGLPKIGTAKNGCRPTIRIFTIY